MNQNMTSWVGLNSQISSYCDHGIIDGRQGKKPSGKTSLILLLTYYAHVYVHTYVGMEVVVGWRGGGREVLKF